MKLEYQTDNNPSSRVDNLCEITRDVQLPEVESASFIHEVPPWAESYEISATEVDGMELLSWSSLLLINYCTRTTTGRGNYR